MIFKQRAFCHCRFQFGQPALLHLKVFLQGAYMGNGIIRGLMGIIKAPLPSNQPITVDYTCTGLQGGTEMVDPAVLI